MQAIINSTNNNWMGFPFLFSLCACASVVIWFVDVEKGRENCRAYVDERKLVRVRSELSQAGNDTLHNVAAAERGSGGNDGDAE